MTIVSGLSYYLISWDCVSRVLNKFASENSFLIRNLDVISRIYGFCDLEYMCCIDITSPLTFLPDLTCPKSHHSSPPTLPSNSKLSSEQRALLNNFTTIILHILSISPVLNKTIKLIQKAETGATLDTFCWMKNNHQSENSGRRETSTYTGMYYRHQARENTISVSSFL